MTTIKQIAELAGVSRRTVDRVINKRGVVKPETEAKILKIIAEHDYRPNAAGKVLAAGKKKIKLCFCSTTGKNSVIHGEIRKGAQAKKSELKKYGIDVDILIIDRNKPYDSAAEERIIDNFDYNGLAIIPNSDLPLIDSLIRKANSLEIPIVFYNTDSKKYNRMCYVGCDYLRSGKIAAGLASLFSNSEGRVGIFSVWLIDEKKYQPSYHERVEGFLDELKFKYPNMEVVGEYPLGNDIFEYYDKIREVLNAHSEMNIIYLVNPGDYSACEAINKAVGSKKIKIITNDLTKKVSSMLKNEEVSATISQNPFTQGSLSLELLYNKLVLDIAPKQEINYTDLGIYISQSIQDC